jgi:hypothetical protein
MDLPIIFFISVIIVEFRTWSQSQNQLSPIQNKIKNLSLMLCMSQNCTHLSDVTERDCLHNFAENAHNSVCDDTVKWFFIKDNVRIIKVYNTEFSSYNISELDK